MIPSFATIVASEINMSSVHFFFATCPSRFNSQNQLMTVSSPSLLANPISSIHNPHPKKDTSKAFIMIDRIKTIIFNLDI